MIEIFWTDKYINFLKYWYWKFWKAMNDKVGNINFLFIQYLPPFREIIISFLDENVTNKKFENIINTLKNKYKPFRIRILFYSRLTNISEDIAKKYWLEKQYTQIINLNQPLESIFKNFRSTYRNEINKYLKWKIGNIEIKKISTFDKLELENFYTLYSATIQKAINKWANLIIEPFDYFQKMLKILNNNIILYNLYKDWKLINSALIVKDENGIYYLKWASNDKKEYRKLWWGRILHYEIIKDNLWNWIYDLWWINWNNLNDPITRFKIGFWWKTIGFYWGNIIISSIKEKIFNYLVKIYKLIKK